MNDNVTKLPPSPYASSPELANDLRRIVSSAWDGGFKSGHAQGWHAGYDAGFIAGEAVARQECVNGIMAHGNKMLGLGVMLGTGIGVVLAVFVGAWLPPGLLT